MNMKLIKKVRKILRPVKRFTQTVKGHIAHSRAKKHFNSEYVQIPHTLPNELIISLTSYTPRFNTLLPTLQCLLSQSVKPDRIILWIAYEEMDKLPSSIRDLAAYGLDIRTTSNIKSFKKLIPSLIEFPNAFIVTVDDDTYYGPNWLKELVEAWDGKKKTIVCHSAYRIRYDENGNFKPYNEWEWNIKGPADDEDIFPVGFGGILYPPHVLHPDVLNKSAFLSLTSGGDDIWFYWMGRKNGASYRKTANNNSQIVWPNSQQVSLAAINTGRDTGYSQNDEQIDNMVQAFGMPIANHVRKRNHEAYGRAL